MLSNFELESIAKTYQIPLVGVYQKDMLPYPAKQGNYIVNLQSSTEGNGTHYTCFVLDENKHAFYYDSFGAPPPKEVDTFVISFKPIHYAYNKEIIQDLKNECCGYYCLSFFLYRKHHNKEVIFNTALDYIKLFKDNTMKNLEILKDIFRRYTGKFIHPMINRLFNLKK
jgi:hypothetical protein